MSRLIDTDALPERDGESIRLIDANAINYDDYWWHKGYTARDCQQAAKLISEQPTVEAIPIEWIKKHIENDRQSAEKAKAEKNDKLLHYYKTLEICAECLLFDWEDENGKYKEFDGEIWKD